MSSRKRMIKAGGIVVAAVFAVNAMAGSAAFGMSNPLIISEVVCAEETGAFDGTYTYVVNNTGEPEPAIINAGATIAVAMFKDTIIQLQCNAGVVPVVTAGCDVAAAAVNATNDGVFLAGAAVGSGVLTVQDTATGAITYIAVNVLESVGTGTAAATTATTDTSTQIATTAYSYADNHKIVSSDGMLELNLDNITWSTRHYGRRSAPKMYYASDGILTIELYGDMYVQIGYNCYADGYIAVNEDVRDSSKISISGPSTSKAKGTTEIKYMQIAIPGDGATHGMIKNESTQLPIRVISLGEYSADIGKGDNGTYKSDIPMTFPNY